MLLTFLWNYDYDYDRQGNHLSRGLHIFNGKGPILPVAVEIVFFKNIRQFFSLWYWGKSMMKNQQLYAEKSAYICWDFSRSFRPKTPPTTPFALFWHINFAGPKRKLALSHKVSFVFFKFYIICEMDTLSGLYYELFREKVIICGFSHTWFWSNTRPTL